MKTQFGEGKYTIIIVVVAILLASLLLVRLLSTRTQEEATITKQPMTTPIGATETPAQQTPAAETPAQQTPEKGNLMAWADQESDAEEIASLYGITLLTYTEHIAVYWTDQNPAEVIQLGKTNGWPELSKINKVKGF